MINYQKYIYNTSTNLVGLLPKVHSYTVLLIKITKAFCCFRWNGY